MGRDPGQDVMLPGHQTQGSGELLESSQGGIPGRRHAAHGEARQPGLEQGDRARFQDIIQTDKTRSALACY